MRGTSIRGFSPALNVEVEDVIEHFNGNHADTVLFIAQFAGGASGARRARISAISPRGITLVTGNGVASEVKLDFAAEAQSLEQLQAAMVGLVERSQELAGCEVAPTKFARLRARNRTLPTFVSTVARVRSITPQLREITFAGGLAAFSPSGPDDYLFTMVDRPGREGAIRDGVTLAGLREGDKASWPLGAYYTVRRFRPEAEELDLWFVLHDHGGGLAQWAGSAKPGDRAALWGPKQGFNPPEGTQTLLLIGDETALPAIAGILEETNLPTRVLLETTDAANEVPLPENPRATIDWVHRGTTPAHESTALIEAVMAGTASVNPGLYVFGAAETSRVRSIRRHLRAVSAHSSQMHLAGYWRHGKGMNR